MNKNILLGAGLLVLGVVLAKRAKDKGKDVPFIGRFIPSASYDAANTPATPASFSGADSGDWNY